MHRSGQSDDSKKAISTIKIHASFTPKFNLAFMQNSVPVLLELSIENHTDDDLASLELSLSSSPSFVKKRVWHIESIGHHQRLRIKQLNLELDNPMLMKLNEAEMVQVSLSLSQGDALLADYEQVIELLPRNHWAGVDHMPEMIAAHVLPNDRQVELLLKKTAEILRRNKRDAALNGYQGGPKRAWELTSAIWGAMGAMALDYSLPPSSFEYLGQKVRAPNQIADAGIATCLDLAVLICATLEQCGLNPVIVFTKGHAFAGVWLKDEDFSAAVVDDVSALRKRIQLQELIVFETTLLTQRPTPSLKHAIAMGVRQVEEKATTPFELLVDIKRARMQRIKPLASGSEAPAAEKIEQEELPIAFDEAPDLPDEEIRRSDETASRPVDRLELWQRKLLDLTLRNNLLNFKTNNRTIVLDAPEPGQLEDRLADGKVLRLKPRPDLMDGTDARDITIHEAQSNEDLRKQHALDALRRDEILVAINEKELDARLTDLYRVARSTLSEGGANTLFLAVGFLVWNRDNKDERKFRAPLVLIPVVLNRRSVRDGFSLTLHDDEARFNPTLVQMLRQDFALELPVVDGALPEDEHGLDVDGIWRVVSQSVKEIKGWEVSREVVLSTFSFAKYLMWKDLVDRTEQLKQNPVVRHLIDTPRDPYPNYVDFPEPRTLDQLHSPQETFCPLPADSSQLSAVMAAARGKDFVLIGPPGTGKSQTIANLIAQCLAEQKTVLFVSEKIAALDVVYRRLREVGLGDFCLELHSNKARKLEVLQQLGRAWASKGSIDAAEWQREAEKLKTVRFQLNAFVKQLHCRRYNGLTAYRAIGQMLAGSHVVHLDLAWPSPDIHDIDALDQLRDLADRLDVNARDVGKVANNPLAYITHDAWSPHWQQQMVAAAQQLVPRTASLSEAASSFARTIGVSIGKLNERTRRGLRLMATVLPKAAGHDWQFVLRPDARSLIDGLQHGTSLIQQHQQIFQQLSAPYRPEVIRLDANLLRLQWQQACDTFWPMRWFKQRTVRKLLAEHLLQQQPIEVAADLERIEQLRTLEVEIGKLDSMGAKTGGIWCSLTTQLDETERVIQFQKEISGAIAALSQDLDSAVSIKSAIEKLLGVGNSLLDSAGPVCGAGSQLIQSLDAFDAAVDHFAQQAGNESEEVMHECGDNPAVLAKIGAAIPSRQQNLRSWCAWRKARNEAVTVGLEPLVLGLEQGQIEPGSVRDAFETNYCRWWLNSVVDGDEVLRSFVSVEHEKRIEDFRKLDDRFTEMTQQYIHAGLCADLPDQSNVTRKSEWGILRRELQKKRAHKPLRELISLMPETITKLTPCLLMSPLSIAQYLSVETALFDLVVFDEASQISVWDAIGAIARGKQVVMVGDPKQLPPTSFFNRAASNSDDDLDEDVEADLESILDECIGANLPTMNLSWHYRSRHESLIAFSNHRYYNGGLVTFPSPVTDDRAVSLQRIADGMYEKGGARINKPEAKALVSELVGRLLDHTFQASQLTIGVVTFNSEQQRLIEDLLDEARRQHPEIEPYFAEDALEPVFVKNLESVQGDERDIMYFSIGYGPDLAGKISMNFGPMNRSGGERRLNVAITRARHELRVFSSLGPEQIDLSRTQAKGVHDLKHFLEFAERGASALAEAVSGSQGGYDSPFEEAVAKALRSKGWVVHSQVGVSSFRIDLGVVDPDAPGRYIAGVECDGATYHRSATARDRDKLREQVLRGLGWKIVRIWSTDWWINAPDALEKTHVQLQQLLEQARNHGKKVADDV
ncbi:MAG: DNA helicase [Zetaproteobacteria bacterium CG_4_9_14_3_um_filter_49_83]|nr:MAG: DNA helicase [Zetaproteobacteria bacterium CG1_02_49_23]PIQ30858.1 MAG: DNA helicase [Zetaproteobacteria bacterium CG17_big_fil_post_rev_8_21_14_2_50_50_13]PIV31255.1 MAG: DNA helicase [Zetaproteobacteria bacterium CG02_land_8_20_14_3_00_50_9]PIY56114.1 MAG: DNA helicase [Zetaproteobacteria bacterium CG_4_10_14_0_8_um_filter_49_80]PJA34554.1 MAG: DNA helicase [Zetaproteobacteria bacterium CG_4_9_14_3_um_filter_49_83]